MTLQYASTSDADTDDERRLTMADDVKIVFRTKLKPFKAKCKNGRDQDQSTPAKKPRHSAIKERNHHKWKCAICTVGFGFWNELNMHVKSAHEETNEILRCGYCKKSYKSKGNLRRHVRTAHSADLPVAVDAVTEETVLVKDTENISHSKGMVPPILPPKEVADTTERTVLIKDKENIEDKNKHNSVGTQKKSVIQYECIHCRKTEDTFDAAVYHAQVHLVQEALTKENGTQYKLAFDNHKNSLNNSSLIKIKFDYKTLLEDAWFDMFRDLSIPLEIQASSLYKHTRCVKLNWDSGSRNEEEGRCVLLYKCGACKLILNPAKVQNHCDKNGACEDFRVQGHKCTECQISFCTPKALRRHKERHENNQPLMIKIATFNNKDDIHFNNVLKQILRSSVDDTHEATELEGISRHPGTLKNYILEKNNDVRVAKYCVQCKKTYFDFEAHNAYHANKTNRTMETILGQIQPSCSVEAGANIVSPEESVSHDDNTSKEFLKNRSEVQVHKENTVEASKDNYSDIIENYSKSAVTVWGSDNDSNDSNGQSSAELNIKKFFRGVFTKKEEILQKNSNDNINSDKQSNYDNVAKEEKDGENDQNDQSAFKRRRISGEDNSRGGMLEADSKSQSTKGQQALEDDVESVHSRDNSEVNGDFDQPNREIQEDTRTPANGGALESSEYVSLNNSIAILHGSFNQEDIRFNSSRGKQCTGIAAVACAAFCVHDPNTWTQSIIDKIVVIGDRYYNHCIASRTLPAAGEVNPDYLAVTDLMSRIIFNKLSVPIAFEEDTNLNGHIDNDDSSKGFPNLKNALKGFFRRHASGILTSNAMSVAVYCKTVGESYWLFDSHSRGLNGGPAEGGAACCMRFSNLNDLHALLRRNLFVSPCEVPSGRDLINNLNVFSLTSLRVIQANGKVA